MITKVYHERTINTQQKGLFHKSSLNSKKTRAALALAISLWIGGAGVALADGNNKTIVINGGTDKFVYNGALNDTAPEHARPRGEKDGFHAIFNGGRIQENVFGGYSWTRNAMGNYVTMNNVIADCDVYGGYAYGDDLLSMRANNNVVTIIDSRVKYHNVYGGEAPIEANGNTVNIIRSSVDGSVYGGATYGLGHSTGNTISMTDSTASSVAGGIGGNADEYTGNTLNLYGANTVAGDVFRFETVYVKSAHWGTPALTASAFYKVDKIDASGFRFTNPGAANGSMTLLSGSGFNNLYLHGVSNRQIYKDSPLVDGVTVNGILLGEIERINDSVIRYKVNSNVINKMTFGKVEWKDTGALYTRPNNTIIFNGADVDTTNITFTNIRSLDANKTMTLVSDFGETVGTITGTKYTIGSTLEGDGRASLVDSDQDGTMDALIFTAETGVRVQEQTHHTVMGAGVGMAALSVGNDFVGAATEGLAMAGNTGTDGVAAYANMGGGSMNVETGSHVNTRTWNAILALGHKNEKKLSTTEYGAFFEYGTGNYSTFNGDKRGDGHVHYTGGGILGKWQKNNGFYVEGSLRAGSIHDDANNLLRDSFGNPYSYNTGAPYWGVHIGVGRAININTTDILDIYARYFYNRRGSVSFDAGGHYDLDAVESSVLRIGTRYTVKKSDKINYYGGLALEHEFCGRATGFADGLAIRGADISGTSLRGEIGATFQPDEKSNVTLDLNLSGFAGKKRGIMGGLSAVFHI